MQSETKKQALGLMNKQAILKPADKKKGDKEII